MLHMVVARLTFCARFVPYGRALLYYIYAAPSGAPHLNFMQYKAAVCSEMANDVTVLAPDLQFISYFPLLCAPEPAHPGAQVLSSDTSASFH